MSGIIRETRRLMRRMSLTSGAVQRGSRVELVRCSDPYTKLNPGDRGTVSMIDSVGTVHVDWDSGSRLGLVPDEDEFVVIGFYAPTQGEQS